MTFSTRKLLGTTTKALYAAIDEREVRTISSFFFKPYKSPSNALFRTTSIITDAPVLGTFSAVLAVMTVYELFKAVGNLLIGHFKESLGNLQEFKDGLLATIGLAALAIFSPIINTIDLVGGSVNSVRNCCASTPEGREELEGGLSSYYSREENEIDPYSYSPVPARM
ncbi:hypothetical protein [Legionella fallonii]|uniref:Uncharacterized protein n=1 Tax=Legionella fallonii LLAP-10 TaxID=1212491 RepID=A0A098G630_9GAMM|nr:hypothetical protein [Legionella fallonii]CEG57426.1 protein of unknown function [Legionella fallonii LLAP-10]